MVWVWLLLPGKSICVLEPVQSVQHRLRRSPAAITKSKQQCTVINSAFVSVVSHSFHQLLAKGKCLWIAWFTARTIGETVEQLHSRHSLCHSFHRSLQVGSESKPGSHPALPRKMCCAGGRKESKLKTFFMGKSCTSPRNVHSYRKGVDQIPAELLCHETGDATASHDLRKLGWVAKSIWQPKLIENRVKQWFMHEKGDHEGFYVLVLQQLSHLTHCVEVNRFKVDHS